MPAFDPVRSGIPEMDSALNYIRLGDNVVFRVSDLDEFRAFALPYLRSCAQDGRTIVYVRFADHDPIVSPEEAERLGIHVENVKLSYLFETFTVDVHNLITRYGREVMYIFDCLSDLQTAWATDLMMGNFFRVTCPYLFQLDTVAFFPLIRGRHSLQAQSKIRNTTQLFLDVYSEFGSSDILYVRPVKVWNRSSETMFSPHIFDRRTGSFQPITNGVSLSRFYRAFEAVQRPGEEQNVDSWDRFFHTTSLMMQAGIDVSAASDRMCDIMMSRDKRIRELIKKTFKPQDYFQVRDRMIGTGMIGGKACGMLLARKIIERQVPDVYRMFEPHDSFYLGSDVFYSYIVDNGFWDLKLKQRSDDGYFACAEEFAEKLKGGSFDDTIRDRFRFLLDYYGHDPYIVRSSSILEDGFGNAFAGKYESIFCANTGTPEERLEELENAVRTVYASTMSMSALDYRRKRGLDRRDEQMALLIQRVSGSHYGKYFMPCAAGVGYSCSPWKIHKDADPKAGMLRLVMGLGTSAVDRTEGSYPRIVGLDRPEMTAYSTVSDRHRYSQRKIELIDSEKKQLVRIYPEGILPRLPFYVKKALLEHDWEAERSFRDSGKDQEVLFVTCKGLVKNEKLMAAFRTILRTLENAYQYPVDIEYTVNLTQDGDFVLNLLQCRPLQAFHDTGAEVLAHSPMPDTARLDPGSLLLECRHASMGISCVKKIDAIVYVDPLRYYQLDYAKKPAVAHLIGRLNRKIANLQQYTDGKQYTDANNSEGDKGGFNAILMVPGRIATSSPELGVPCAFSEISCFSAILEIAESRAGYNPELSYGSHIFQDLVESEILYAAVFENENTLCWQPELLKALPRETGTFLGDTHEKTAPDMEKTVHLYLFDGKSGPECTLWHDMQNEHLLINIG